MSQIEEINLGVSRFFKDIDEALIDRRLELEQSSLSENELALADIRLGRIEDYFSAFYPTDITTMNKFQLRIETIGADYVDKFSSEFAKYIFEYLSQGVTMQSIIRGEKAGKKELNKYVISKGRNYLLNRASEEKDIPQESLGWTHTFELAQIISSAGLLFFDNNHNTSGDAIKSGFISGVGVFFIWLNDDLLDALSNMSS